MYIAIYGALVMLAIFVRRRQFELVTVFLCLAFLVLFMGTRYYVGCDYAGYLSRYDNTPVYSSLLDAFKAPEPAFNLIMIGVVTSGLDYLWVNLISSAIIVACYWYFLRHHSYSLMILALCFPILIMQLGMSGLRQAIAVAMVMAASIPFTQGRRFATFMWIVVAAQFHTSAYVFLPLVALVGVRVSFGRMTWAAMAALPLLLWLLSDRLEVYQTRYVEQAYGDQSSGGAVFRYFLMFPVSVLFFVNRERIMKAFPNHFETLKIWNLAILALAPLTILSSFALHRFNYYVMPFNLVSFVYVSHLMFTRRFHFVAVLIPPLVYGIYTIGWQSMSSHFRACYVPYQSVLF